MKNLSKLCLVVIIFIVFLLFDKKPKKNLSLKEYQGKVYCLTFSPNGKYLATGGEGWKKIVSKNCGEHFINSKNKNYQHMENIQIWSVNTGKLFKTFSMKLGSVETILFTPESKIVIAENRESVKFFEIEDAENKIFPIDNYWHFINSISISPDGDFLAVGGIHSKGGNTNIYSMRTGEILRPEYKKNLVTNIIRGSYPQFTCDGKILACKGDKGIILYDTKKWQRIRLLSQKCGWDNYKTLSFSPDGKYLIVEGILWSVEKDLKLREFPGYLSRFSYDSKFIANVHHNHSIGIYSIQSGKLLKTLSGHKSKVYTICFSPDNKYLASAGEDSTIKLWLISLNR